jgi:hypothetical protein
LLIFIWCPACNANFANACPTLPEPRIPTSMS